MNRPVLFVRFKLGLVGESRRTVHVVPAPVGGEMTAVLVAYCGQTFEPGQADHLPDIIGMPCELCVVRVPTPVAEDVPPVLPKRDPGQHLGEVLDELETIAVQAITARGSSPAQARLAAHNLELLS